MNITDFMEYVVTVIASFLPLLILVISVGFAFSIANMLRSFIYKLVTGKK